MLRNFSQLCLSRSRVIHPGWFVGHTQQFIQMRNLPGHRCLPWDTMVPGITFHGSWTKSTDGQCLGTKYCWEPNTEHREPSVWESTNYRNEENQRTSSEWVIHSSDSHQHSTLTNVSPSCLGGWVYRTLLGNFSSVHSTMYNDYGYTEVLLKTRALVLTI